MEEDTNFMLLRTGEFRTQDLDEKYIAKELEIFPVHDEKWSFQTVLLFLQGLVNFDNGKGATCIRSVLYYKISRKNR